MTRGNLYKVQWILASTGSDGGGLYGTTSHEGLTPAAAAVASAEYVLSTLDRDDPSHQLMILGVFREPDHANLLSSDDLRATLSYHHTSLPCEVVFRPLC